MGPVVSRGAYGKPGCAGFETAAGCDVETGYLGTGVVWPMVSAGHAAQRNNRVANIRIVELGFGVMISA